MSRFSKLFFTMGIKDLNKVLSKNTKGIIFKNIIDIGEIGRKIGMDGNLILYQLVTATTYDLANPHVNNLVYKILNFLESKITPIFVFDGKSLDIKGDELEKRRNKREIASKLLDESIKLNADKKQIDKYKKRVVRIGSNEVTDARRLLDIFGIQNFIAPSEGEMFLAELSKRGLIDAVATQDMDTLTFGAKVLIRNFNLKKNVKRKTKKVETPAKLFGFDVIYLDKVLLDLNIDMDSFIDLCILLGSDYVKTLPGIGQVKSLEYIKKYKTIENVLENEECEVPSPDWLDRVNEARKTFKSPIPVEVVIDEYDPKGVKIEELKRYLMEMQFPENKLAKVLERAQDIKNDLHDCKKKKK